MDFTTLPYISIVEFPNLMYLKDEEVEGVALTDGASLYRIDHHMKCSPAHLCVFVAKGINTSFVHSEMFLTFTLLPGGDLLFQFVNLFDKFSDTGANMDHFNSTSFHRFSLLQ